MAKALGVIDEDGTIYMFDAETGNSNGRVGKAWFTGEPYAHGARAITRLGRGLPIRHAERFCMDEHNEHLADAAARLLQDSDDKHCII